MAPPRAAAMQSGFAGATNIDRTKCERVVPMEVLVLGLCRTGTSSIRSALYKLGYDYVYHMVSATVENPKDSEMWLRAFDAKYENRGTFGKTEWDQLLGHCMAVTDSPCACFAAELIAAYPDAKVVLTVRDNAQTWADSVLATIWVLTKPSVFRTWGFGWAIDPFKSVGHVLAERITKYYFDSDVPRTAKRRYEEHNAMVKGLVKEGNLLVFNVKEGWGPLCDFLGKEIPEGSFPRVNERDAMTRGIKKRQMLSQSGRDIVWLTGLICFLGVALGLALKGSTMWKRY